MVVSDLRLTILDDNYSTTRLLCRIVDDSMIDENGKIRDELKFSINNPKLNIKDSKYTGNPEEKFETVLFLPESEDRIAEGGLRTKGYFKFSYAKDVRDGSWWIVDLNNSPIEPLSEGNSRVLNSYLTYLTPHSFLPLITIITVVYNGDEYLEEAIQSVINQTYPNIEYIIIDGASTDGTLDIIKKYEDRIDYWVSEKDRGAYYAMNKGIDLAGGSVIGILNADDFYACKDVIHNLTKYLNEKIDIYHGDLIIVERSTKRFIKKRIPKINEIYFAMYLNHPSTFVHRRIYKKLGKFRSEEFKVAADYDFILRCWVNGSRFHYINEVFCYMRDGGMSTKDLEFIGKENYRVRKDNLPFFTFFMTNFRIVRKIMKWRKYFKRL